MLSELEGFVLHEFRVDRLDGATDVIDAGRERWRRRQIKILVRDAPDAAMEALAGLGYTIVEPDGGPLAPNPAKLRTW